MGIMLILGHKNPCNPCLGLEMFAFRMYPSSDYPLLEPSSCAMRSPGHMDGHILMFWLIDPPGLLTVSYHDLAAM